jgi:hypothetical protein
VRGSPPETIKGIGRPVFGLRLNHGDGEVARIAQEVIGAFLWAALHPFADDHNPTICEGLLFRERTRLFVPSRLNKLGQDVFPASVGFGDHGGTTVLP